MSLGCGCCCPFASVVRSTSYDVIGDEEHQNIVETSSLLPGYAATTNYAEGVKKNESSSASSSSSSLSPPQTIKQSNDVDTTIVQQPISTYSPNNKLVPKPVSTSTLSSASTSASALLSTSSMNATSSTAVDIESKSTGQSSTNRRDTGRQHALDVDRLRRCASSVSANSEVLVDLGIALLRQSALAHSISETNIPFRDNNTSRHLVSCDSDKENTDDTIHTGSGVGKNSSGGIDEREAFSWFLKAARQGSHDAMYHVGKCYQEGIGTMSADATEACRWFERSADLGHPNAQFCLAIAFHQGSGVCHNMEKAAVLYKKAAHQGHAAAQAFIAAFYRSGKGGMPKSPEVAFDWYYKSANQGYLSAQYEVAQCYAKGVGTRSNSSEALKYFRLAAAQNDAASLYCLGRLSRDGKWVPKDTTEAVKMFRSAANLGHGKAQYELGRAFTYGRGVLVNEAEAASWYRRAADNEVALAAFHLAGCYRTGSGVDRDDYLAFFWMKVASDGGVTAAEVATAGCYLKGIGVVKSEGDAYKLYFSAAEKDNSNAQYHLATLYRDGVGTERDEDRALHYFKMAADREVPLAQCEMGLCYLYGLLNVPIHEMKAFEWFSVAAEEPQASPVALLLLGECYDRGVGKPRDTDRSHDLFSQAFEGLVAISKQPGCDARVSLFYLGECYFHGYGTPPNWQYALDCYHWSGSLGELRAKRRVKELESRVNSITNSNLDESDRSLDIARERISSIRDDGPPPYSATPPTTPPHCDVEGGSENANNAISTPPPYTEVLHKELPIAVDDVSNVVGIVDVTDASMTLRDARDIIDVELDTVPLSYIFQYHGAPCGRAQERKRLTMSCFPVLVLLTLQSTDGATEKGI